MYVAIDRSTMTFAWKHRSYTVLANLAWIERQNCGVCIVNLDMGLLAGFTPMERELLYKNTFELNYVVNHIPLAAHLLDLYRSYKEFCVVEWEVEAQAAKIKECDTNYRYVKGSVTPRKVNKLFKPDSPIAPINHNIKLVTVTANTLPAKQVTQPVNSIAAPTIKPSVAAQPQAPIKEVINSNLDYKSPWD